MSDNGPEVRSPVGLHSLQAAVDAIDYGFPVFTDDREYIEEVGPIASVVALRAGVDKALATDLGDDPTIYFKFWGFPLPGKRKQRRCFMRATLYISEAKEGSFPWVFIRRGTRPAPARSQPSLILVS